MNIIENITLISFHIMSIDVKKKMSIGVIIAIVVAVVITIVALIIVTIMCIKKWNRKDDQFEIHQDML